MSERKFAKSLKGSGSLSAKFLTPIENTIQNNISLGGVTLSNVDITGGTIDGVVIGSDQPGPANFTTLQSGTPGGKGYEVCFFGLQVGDSACWEPQLGLWDIQGDLAVRDIADLANLRISANTISSTNSNGNINLSPHGVGNVTLNSGLIQNTNSGDTIFNSNLGSFYVDTSEINLRTKEGDLSLEAGYSVPVTNITNITTALLGGIATITTNGINPYNIGDKIKIISDGLIDGYYTITDTPTQTTFKIQLPVDVSIPTSLTNGTITLQSDINLTAKDFINVSVDTKVNFGGDQFISGNILGDIFLEPNTSRSVILSDNTYLQFSEIDTDKKIGSDGTDIILDTGLGKLQINGDLFVNGETTYIKSTTLSITDPVINTGGSDILIADDQKDRGISSNYFSGGSPKLSFFGRSAATGNFTYIPDATNNNEVFTGLIGNADFASIEASSLTLNGGSITNVNGITGTDIVITGTNSISLVSPNLSTSSPLLNLNSTPSIVDKGTSFTYFDTSLKTGFSGWDTSQNAFTFLTNTTNTDGVITGTLAPVIMGESTIDGDLTVTGKILGGISTERLTLTTINGDPHATVNVTFVSVNTNNSVVFGNLISPGFDGFVKNIVISHLASGASYRIVCPSGILLDPGSGTTAAKTLKFTSSGQGINMIWDNTLNAYIIINAGCSIE